MNVFTIEDFTPVVTPEFLMIEEFKELFTLKYNSYFNGEKITNKSLRARGNAEAKFLYFYCDYRSEFAKYSGEERKTEALLAAGLPETYQISDKLEAAITKYNSLKAGRNLRLLTSANTAIDKLQKYFESVDFTELTPDGNPKYNPKDVISNISNLGKVLEGLDKLEEAVRKDEGQESQTRGGADKGRLA